MTDLPECPQRAATDVVGGAGSWAALTAALWSEREALEDVIYKLTTERLILQKAQRWLARADEELERAVVNLRACTTERTEQSSVLAADLGVADTLAAVIAVAPVPWPSVLADHRLALRVLARDVAHAAAAAGRQLRISARAVTESLEEVRLDRGAAMHLALGQFRSVERELLVTAADATHRAAMVTVTRLLADALGPLDQFLT